MKSTIQITYDIETDTVRIRLNDHKIDETNELMAGVIVDVDAKVRAIGFEILDASKRIENPKSVELDVFSGPALTQKKNGKKVAVKYSVAFRGVRCSNGCAKKPVTVPAIFPTKNQFKNKNIKTKNLEKSMCSHKKASSLLGHITVNHVR